MIDRDGAQLREVREGIRVHSHEDGAEARQAIE